MTETITRLIIAVVMALIFIFGAYEILREFKELPSGEAITGAVVSEQECGLRLACPKESCTPSITSQQIEEILKNKNSPAQGVGQFIYDKGIEYGIDPVFVMAWFLKESNFGTDKDAITMRKAKSIGNIKVHDGCPEKVYNAKQGRYYCGYRTWGEGVEDWYRLITGPGYFGQGRDTVEKIVPKYAPATENNVVDYINVVRNFVKKYRDVSCLGITQKEKKLLDNTFKISKYLLGTYAINPSFSVEAESSILSDLKSVESYTSAMVNECSTNSLQEPMECVKKYIASNKADIDIIIGHCGSPEEVVFEQFKENYYDCVNSASSDCVCAFSMGINSGHGQSGEYKIKICNNAEKDCKYMGILLEEPSNTLEPFKMDAPLNLGSDEHESEEKEYLDYFVRYDEQGDFIDGKLGIESTGQDLMWDYNTVLIYKSPHNKITLIKEKKEKKQCPIFKKLYRFCAINKNKKSVFIHNGMIIDDALPVRFALYISDPPPPIVKGMKLQNAKKTDNSVLLSWQKSDAEDVTKYRIYLSEKDFSGWKIHEHIIKSHDGKSEIIGQSFTLDSATNYKEIEFNELPLCEFKNKICTYRYNAIKSDGNPESIALISDTLYYLENEERYYLLTDKLANSEYYFAVTAVDNNDNEIDNMDISQRLTSGENLGFTVIVDDLAPGITDINNPETVDIDGEKYLRISWQMPKKDIDGTENSEKDIAFYNLYYELTDYLSVIGLKEKKTLSAEEALIPLNEFKQDSEYYFAVTAVDRAGNVHRENVITIPLKI